jgi:hypothetical protein
MFKGQRTQCVINPALGQEKRATDARHKAGVAQRVLVAGAGPAGCEAALLAAESGHAVELVEKAERIGGQLHAWGAASVFHDEIANLIAIYEGALARLGVNVRLGTDVASLDTTAFERVLLATGTMPADTDGIDAVEMLATCRAPDAEEITVFGETETALFAHCGSLSKASRSPSCRPPMASVSTATTWRAATCQVCSSTTASRSVPATAGSHRGRCQQFGADRLQRSERSLCALRAPARGCCTDRSMSDEHHHFSEAASAT